MMGREAILIEHKHSDELHIFEEDGTMILTASEPRIESDGDLLPSVQPRLADLIDSYNATIVDFIGYEDW